MNKAIDVKTMTTESLDTAETRSELLLRLREEAIAYITPNMASVGDLNWQKRKSAQTREVLLSATMECLAHNGYADTTTQLVSKTAGISRGAMLHHFATKFDLMSQTVEYTFYRRAKAFYDRLIDAADRGEDPALEGLEVYWTSLRSVEFEAYREFAVASRTDKPLKAAFEQLQKRERENWDQQVALVFPAWEGKLDEYHLAADFMESAMLGLYMNMEFTEPRERRWRVRKLIAIILDKISSGEIGVPDVSDFDTR